MLTNFPSQVSDTELFMFNFWGKNNRYDISRLKYTRNDVSETKKIWLRFNCPFLDISLYYSGEIYLNTIVNKTLTRLFKAISFDYLIYQPVWVERNPNWVKTSKLMLWCGGGGIPGVPLSTICWFQTTHYSVVYWTDC